MKPSGALFFPFKEDKINNCLQRAFTVEDTILSAIRVFLGTRKKSRLGSTFGSIVAELPLELYNKNNISELNSQIQKELTDQFSGINFLSVNLMQDEIQQFKTYLKIKLSISGNITDFIYYLPSASQNS